MCCYEMMIAYEAAKCKEAMYKDNEKRSYTSRR